MAEFVGAVAIEVGKCIAGPIKRQFNYLFCFNNNIQNLRDQAKKLNEAKDGVEGQVDAATRNVQVILPQVETWLDHVNTIQASMSAIETEIGNMERDCLAIKARFSLSRKSTKMAADMKVLLDNTKLGQIFHHAPLAATSLIPLGQTYELESRKHFEEDIMTALREKKVSMMGICGMAGMGKTFIAKKISSRARREGLFDEIVMMVVSPPAGMMRIQQEMAEFLGLRLNVESIPARAHLLRSRLMNAKSILIILDDLWERLNLEDLGIPHQSGLTECTILLTSRSREVFRAMNVEKTFPMKILEDAEAWSLFKEKVGACADDPNLFPTAQKIVRACQGIPVALVTVGWALKENSNISNWKDALQKLRSANPIHIPDFLAPVYNLLKLSYDLLETDDARFIFLLCCVFPEDCNIFISDLTLYAWGLGMFKGVRTLQDARNRADTLVEMLKSGSLLLDGSDKYYVKMKRVVRSFGLFIAAEEEGLMDPSLTWSREHCNETIDSTWISLSNADKIMLSEGSVFPNLCFLLIHNGPCSKEFPFNDSFFESTRKLEVLSIGNCILRSNLPHTIKLLKNMRTLILESCECLEDISVVGELVSLEIFFCRDCGSIKELPTKIGRLNQLKLLHISDCASLKTIAAGVISRLVKLEELTLLLLSSECPQMERFSAGSLTSSQLSFENLKSIEITSWSMLELGLWNESHRITFPKLDKLHLHDLPRLTSLCKGIEFPLLTRMEIVECPNLKTLVTSNENDKKYSGAINQDADNSLRFFSKIEDIVHNVSIAGKKGLIKTFPIEQTIGNIDDLAADNITSIFPNLHFLLINYGPYPSLPECPSSEFFLESMRKFNVLYIGHCTFIPLPKIHLLKNIRKLIFESCLSLEDISVVGELISLEGLFCLDCGSIKELPVEIGRLNQLKLLHISDCASLKKVAAGVISSLENLEELTLIGSFKNWKRVMEEGENAALNELNSLHHLTTLRIEIEDASLAAEQVHLPNLVEFNIRIGNPTVLFHTSTSYERVMQLLFETNFIVGDWIHQLVRSTENLVLQGKGSTTWAPLLPECHILKRLIIQNAKLTRLSDGETITFFPLLESLCLKDIDNFEEIHNGPISSYSFKNLREIVLKSLPKLQHLWNVVPPFCNISSIRIAKCDGMGSLFPWAMAGDYLSRLQRIRIWSDSMFEQVVLENEKKNGENRREGKLQFLDLHDLPRFTSLYKGIDIIEFTFNSQKSRTPMEDEVDEI